METCVAMVPRKPKSHKVSQPRSMPSREAAEYLGVSRKVLKQLSLDGEIPFIPGRKPNSSWLYEKADLDRWIDGRKIKYPPKN